MLFLYMSIKSNNPQILTGNNTFYCIKNNKNYLCVENTNGITQFYGRSAGIFDQYLLFHRICTGNKLCVIVSRQNSSR